MKEISIFYKIFKIAVVIADVFLAGILSVLLVCTYLAEEGFITLFILSLIIMMSFAVLEILLLQYYQNIVISVGFTADCVVINTNKESYTLPKKYFTRVKEETSNGRTYIFYKDGVQERKFVYIMRYAFKTRHLDIGEMIRQMPYTSFE